MKRSIWLFIVCSALAVNAQADLANKEATNQEDVSCYWDKATGSYIYQPSWTCHAIIKNKINLNYTLESLTSYYVLGDFDGDRKLDIAMWVKSKQSKKYGIVIVNSLNREVFVIGAGNATDFGENLNVFDIWEVLPKQKLVSPLEKTFVQPSGDALFFNSPEGVSAALYWNGKKYIWFRIGD